MIWTKDLLSCWGTQSPLQIHSDKAPALIHVTSSSECHYNHGSYNLEKVLNFISHLEKSLNLVKVREKYLLSLLLKVLEFLYLLVIFVSLFQMVFLYFRYNCKSYPATVVSLQSVVTERSIKIIM